MDSRVFIRYWLPVLAWMLVIFSASTDLMSGRRTSRLIEPLLRWLVPDISSEALRRAHFVVRKAGHVTEYAVLALLLWRARRKPVPKDLRPWNWREAAWAVGLAALYAVSDELHQWLVVTRTASAWDVALDTSGALLGILCLWVLGFRRRKI
ncbi:MAG: VanZ family protein [Verrucomicrobia bacterium]|nr:VanZ family protein [Verrucomicrobiota bacterium]